MYENDTLLFPSGGRSNYRIPSLVAAADGTVFAFCNDRKDTLIDHADETALVCAIRSPGGAWSEIRTLIGYPGWGCHIGSAIYDEAADAVLCTFSRTAVAKNEFGHYTEEERRFMAEEAARIARETGIAQGTFFLTTRDHGESWAEAPYRLIPTIFTHSDGSEALSGGSCHGSAHGITLRHGTHAGRLVCPSRFAAAPYQDWDGLRHNSYNNCVYSDDGGKSWIASKPVQVGTGEGTLIERADGTILYNSRAYFGNGKRYLAVSRDGGESWGEFAVDGFLEEEIGSGCNASFLRVERSQLGDSASLLPGAANSVTLFANPRSKTRDHMTVCFSFDDGASWAGTKPIWEEDSAYSSLDFSAIDGRFYLLYERGRNGNPYADGIALRTFDLEWLLA